VRCDGARVRAARERKPHPRSQSEIAHRMRYLGLSGVEAPWVSMVERGMTEVSEVHATALAAALGVALTEILPPAEATGILLARLAEELEQFATRLADVAGLVAGEHLIARGRP
jgi:transcriptional regulator with XRE-family HTH domain